MEGNEKLNYSEVIKTAFSVYFSNFFMFLSIVVVSFLPYILYAVIEIGSLKHITTQNDVKNFAFRWVLANVLLFLVLQPIAAASITYGVFQKLRGGEATIGKCMNVGISRLLPVLGVGILGGLAALGGMILLIIPGIIIAMMFSVGAPVCVVEQKGPIESLKRSKELTHGNKMVIFGIFFLLGIAQNVIDKIFEKAMVNSPQTYLSLTVVFTVVWTGLMAVVPVVVYYELRKMKEMLDIDQLLKFFD